MKQIAFIFWFISTITLSSGQVCGDASARMHRLKSMHSIDSIYRWVQSDLEFIQFKKHDTIADIGSYDGQYPGLYSIFTDSSVIYLNDIDNSGFQYTDSIRTICERIREKPITNKFILRLGTDSCTNLPSNSFHTVVIRDGLHHFKFREIMLLDIKRIMKPGAKLILYEPIKSKDSNEKYLCAGSMTEFELKKLLNDNGFELVKEQELKGNRYWFEFKISKH